jgi:hypothetical protein
MSHKDELAPRAEILFVENLMSVAAIAEKLGVPERTVRQWKQDGGWDEKRARSLDVGGTLKERMARIADKTAKLCEDLLDQGEVPERHLYSFIVQYGLGQQRLQEFERLSAPPEDEKETKRVPTEADIEKAKQLLGLT